MRVASFRFPLILLALVAAMHLAPVAAQVMPDPAWDLKLQTVPSSGATQPGIVHALLRQPDGRMLVGGIFNRAANGALVRTALLRLERDGTIDPTFAPEFGGLSTVAVYSLAVSGGEIYAGGFFDSVNGTTMRSIVRLRADGSLAPGFASPFSTAGGNQIRAIAVTANGLFLGGDTQEGASYGLLRLNRDTGAIETAWQAQTQFSPTGTPSAGNRGTVSALQVSGNDLIVGGEFGQIAGTVRQGLARISQSVPATVSAFNAGISGRVDAMHLSGTQLYIGGNFFHSNPNINFLARIDATSGSFDAGWSTPISGSILALLRIGDHVYVGGAFANQPPGGARLARVAVAGGGVDASFAPLADNTVRALADSCRGRLDVGGSFATVGGIARNGYAAFVVPQIDCIFHGNFEIR